MSKLQPLRTALVVGCTNSKTIPPAPTLLVRNLPRACATDWARRLEEAPIRRPLVELYKGAQWRASLDLAAALEQRGRSVDTWVMSAGLGLRPAISNAPAYGATFGSGSDQVGPTPDARLRWWQELNGATISTPIRDVRGRYDEVLVVLSPAYLQVLAPELSYLNDDGVAVVSSLAIGHPRERISRGLRAALGGGDAVLNQRAAQQLADLAGSAPIGSAVVEARWKEWADARVHLVTYERERMADEDIKALIFKWQATDRRSATVLLRRLRDAGHACEQGRFSRLFKECEATP